MQQAAAAAKFEEMSSRARGIARQALELAKAAIADATARISADKGGAAAVTAELRALGMEGAASVAPSKKECAAVAKQQAAMCVEVEGEDGEAEQMGMEEELDAEWERTEERVAQNIERLLKTFDEAEELEAQGALLSEKGFVKGLKKLEKGCGPLRRRAVEMTAASFEATKSQLLRVFRCLAAATQLQSKAAAQPIASSLEAARATLLDEGGRLLGMFGNGLRLGASALHGAVAAALHKRFQLAHAAHVRDAKNKAARDEAEAARVEAEKQKKALQRKQARHKEQERKKEKKRQDEEQKQQQKLEAARRAEEKRLKEFHDAKKKEQDMLARKERAKAAAKAKKAAAKAKKDAAKQRQQQQQQQRQQQQ